jgi:hypothetical protein
MFPLWPHSFGDQCKAALDLTIKKPEPDDELELLDNNVSISSVMNIIQMRIGLEYTDELKAQHLSILKQLLLFNVDSLRVFSGNFETIGLPTTIISYLSKSNIYKR